MHFTACKILWRTIPSEHFFPIAHYKRRWQRVMMCQAVESKHGIVRCVLHLAVTGLDRLTLFPHCPKLAFPYPKVLPYTEHSPRTPFSPQVSQCPWFPFLSCTIPFLKSRLCPMCCFSAHSAPKTRHSGERQNPLLDSACFKIYLSRRRWDLQQDLENSGSILCSSMGSKILSPSMVLYCHQE